MAATRLKTETLVIGSGIAGCTAALELADKGREVTLITSGDSLNSGNTDLAQGGIIYKGLDDSPDKLAADIFSAGDNYNSEAGVRQLCEQGPLAVEEILLGRVQVPFDRTEDGELYRTREGGHSERRILTRADYTGHAIQECLSKAVEAHPNIRILRNHTAIDLLTTHHHSTRLEHRYQLEDQCAGVYVFNGESKEAVTMLADQTVLCTGGLGQIFQNTTNSRACIGSGISMAHRAGVTLMNMEYIQFHPTSLFHRAERKFLISEAVRGEGAQLFNLRGERFMMRYDERLELAPRDIVARAIADELLKSGDDYVLLDAANYVDKDLQKRFPTIFQACQDIGVNMAREPIPVVPSAHYSCGGILVDAHGRTTLKRLYAAGEVACTGLHGANRLASTSLLEGLVWGRAVAQDILSGQTGELGRRIQDAIPDWIPLGKTGHEDPALINQDWETIRSTMWNYMGIVRTTPRLERAFEDLRDLNKRLHTFYKSIRISKESIDLFHGCQVAYITTAAALLNKSSHGCHFRRD